MRTLLAIVILAVLAWSGYWFWGASARKSALEDWLAMRRADGWVAEAAAIEVNGFPNRLDATVSDFEIADPDSGWAWQGELFQILSLSYKPNHLIAVWPGPQTISTPVESIRIEGDRLRGSVVFDPNTSLTLNRSAIEMDKVRFTGDTGWDAAIGHATLATRQTEAVPFSHDIALDAADIAPPADWLRLIDAEVLPRSMQSLKLDATVAFDRPWNRAAVEEQNPAVKRVELREFSANWGELDLRGKGALTADDEGYAVGKVQVRARNWRPMLEIAESTGALQPTLASAIRTGLDVIAMLSGDKNSVTVPLEFRDGKTRIGPVVIGDAPRLARAN
jgi:hypothetical protein